MRPYNNRLQNGLVDLRHESRANRKKKKLAAKGFATPLVKPVSLIPPPTDGP
jgi:hypothetical protein